MDGQANGRSPGCGAEGSRPWVLIRPYPLRSATAATAPPAAPAGEGGPPGPPPNLTSNRRLQQTQAQVDEVSCVWVGAAKDSRKDTEGWQTSAGVHRGLEVIAVHAYEFWDKDILCPIPVSVHLKGS